MGPLSRVRVLSYLVQRVLSVFRHMAWRSTAVILAVWPTALSSRESVPPMNRWRAPTRDGRRARRLSDRAGAGTRLRLGGLRPWARARCVAVAALSTVCTSSGLGQATRRARGTHRASRTDVAAGTDLRQRTYAKASATRTGPAHNTTIDIQRHITVKEFDPDTAGAKTTSTKQQHAYVMRRVLRSRTRATTRPGTHRRSVWHTSKTAAACRTDCASGDVTPRTAVTRMLVLAGQPRVADRCSSRMSTLVHDCRCSQLA